METKIESTERLARAWERSIKRIKSAKSELRSAETAMLNAQNAIGARIDPGDQKPDESISLWVRLDDRREAVLVSRKIDGSGNGTYQVRFR